MNVKERIQFLCKKNGITSKSLEEHLGFGKGYISKIDKSAPNLSKIKPIADYFGVTVDYLMTGKEATSGEVELTSKDERDITNDLRKMMANIRNAKDGPLYFEGKEIDEASMILLENALGHAMRETKKINKQRFGRRKDPK